MDKEDQVAHPISGHVRDDRLPGLESASFALLRVGICLEHLEVEAALPSTALITAQEFQDVMHGVNAGEVDLVIAVEIACDHVTITDFR